MHFDEILSPKSKETSKKWAALIGHKDGEQRKFVLVLRTLRLNKAGQASIIQDITEILQYNRQKVEVLRTFGLPVTIFSSRNTVLYVLWFLLNRNVKKKPVSGADVVALAGNTTEWLKGEPNAAEPKISRKMV